MILARTEPRDLVVLPEGALSGHSDDLSFLERLDPDEVEAGLDELQREAARLGVYIWVDAVRREHGRWRKMGVGLTPSGELHTYRKVNLATHERGVLQPFGDGERSKVMHRPSTSFPPKVSP